MPKQSKKMSSARPIEDDPFASFAEWSTGADDKAFAHLADREKRLEALRAAIDVGDASGIADEFDFNAFLKSRRHP